MSSQTNLRLDELLAECVRADEAGRPLDPESLVARHPDLADELRAFFANRRAVERLAAPLRDLMPADTPTIGTDRGEAGGGEPGPGTVIRYFGDYEILAEIARGGMGIVYKARQTKLQRVVALKMILAGQLATPADVQRFRQEAESAAQLDHPHIVPIYEIGEHEGQHYFSMKLIEGGNLRDQLARMHKQPAVAVRTLATAARAVHHAHQRGVLHRDLKPSNILLDREGQPHVTDFGLAKRVESASDLTHTGAILGTPSYMAPEQAGASKQLTTAADIYSLGAILYELLAGKPPFAAESPVETLLAVINREPETLRKLRPDVDRDLETICHKCLDKDPQQRYDSAAALAAELERWGRGEPILARPASAFEQAMKWARREPVAAGLTGVIGACVLLLIVGLAVALSRESDRVAAEQILRKQAEDSGESANERVYFAKMLLAHSALEQRQIGQVQRALNDTRPDFRNWEWRYLKHRIDSHLRTLPVGDDPSLARFSDDGKHIFYPGDFSFAGRIPVDGSGKIIQGSQGTGYGHTQGAPIPNVAVNRRQTLFVAANRREVILYDLEREQVPADGTRVTFGNGAVLADKHVLESRPAEGGFFALMRAACFSSDEKVVYVSGDKRLCCFDVAERKLLWEIPLESKDSWAIAVSPDGTRLAFSTDDKAARVITLADKQEIFRSEPHLNQVDDLVFTGDGNRLMTHCSFANPRLYDLETKEQLLKISGGWGTVTQFNRDRTLAATGMTEGQIILWDTATGKITATLRGGHTYWPYCLAFSHDGQRLASGGRDKAVVVWDVAKKTKLKTLLGHHNPVTAIDFSPDDKLLLTADGREGVRLWEVDAPANPQQHQVHAGLITGWAMFPDNRRLVVGGHWYSDDKKYLGLTEIYDLATGKIVRTLGPQGKETTGVAVSEDGKVVVIAASDGSLALWNPDTGEKIKTLHEAVPPESQGLTDEGRDPAKWKHWNMKCVALSSDDKHVVAGTVDGRVILYEVASGREVWQVRRRLPEGWQADDFDLEPDGKEGKLRPGMRVVQVQMSSDGTKVFAFANYGTNLFTIYDAVSGRELYVSPALERHDASHFAASPDGRWVVFGPVVEDGQVKLLDLSDLAAPKLRNIPGSSRLTAAAFAPDSKHFVLARGDEVIDYCEIPDVWDSATPLAPLALLKGHERQVEELAFLPGGARLVSVSSDHTIKLWDVKSGIELLSMPLGDDHDSPATHVLVSRDGTRIAATNGFPQSGAGPYHTFVSWFAPLK